TEAPGTADAAAEFEQALRTADTTDRLGAAGFRNAQGQLPVGLRAFGSQEAQLTTVPNPANTVTSNLLRTWSAINLDSRFLTVLDVSGSMADVTPNGKTKAEVVRDAASLGLNEFPDTTEVGLWAFSDQL